LQKFDTLSRELKAIKVFMRYLAKGLEYSLVFEPEYIQDIACRDEKDKEILDELRGAGEYGQNKLKVGITQSEMSVGKR